jgi:ABC-2 type transport system permease protein
MGHHAGSGATTLLVTPYLALLRAGFRRQSTYRLAVLSGLGANVFFGVLRTAVFLALYRERDAVAGLEVADALTYVWLGQAMFGVWLVGWLLEFPESVRSGAFAVELLRPGDPYLRLLAFDLGRNLAQMVVRSTLPLAVAAAALTATLPASPAGWLALAVSMLLAAVVGFQIRFLVLACAFWTADYRFLYQLASSVLWLLSGFVVPTDFLPGPVRAVADASPLYAILMAPLDVALGRGGMRVLAVQAAWIAVLVLAGRLVMVWGTRRSVVHGG